MTKEEFEEWLHHPVTKRVFTLLEDRVHGLRADLGVSAGLDPREDGKKVGAIQAYVDLITIEYEESQND